MTKPTNRSRILRVLYASKQLSHRYIQSELNLVPQSYRNVRRELEEAALVTSGGNASRTLTITPKGEREFLRHFAGKGSVATEHELYEPLCERLRERHEGSIVLNVGSLRRKGAWKNPDVIEVIARPSALGLGTAVRVISYEVKRWAPAWSLASVFEAASHAGFCHQSYLVLEWAKDIEFSHDYLDDYGRHILAGCRRFGVGLYILHEKSGNWRLDRALLASDTHPDDIEVHEHLEYVLGRKRFRDQAEQLRKLAAGTELEDVEDDESDEG